MYPADNTQEFHYKSLADAVEYAKDSLLVEEYIGLDTMGRGVTVNQGIFGRYLYSDEARYLDTSLRSVVTGVKSIVHGSGAFSVKSIPVGVRFMDQSAVEQAIDSASSHINGYLTGHDLQQDVQPLIYSPVMALSILSQDLEQILQTAHQTKQYERLEDTVIITLKNGLRRILRAAEENQDDAEKTFANMVKLWNAEARAAYGDDPTIAQVVDNASARFTKDIGNGKATPLPLTTDASSRIPPAGNPILESTPSKPDQPTSPGAALDQTPELSQSSQAVCKANNSLLSSFALVAKQLKDKAINFDFVTTGGTDQTITIISELESLEKHFKELLDNPYDLIQSKAKRNFIALLQGYRSQEPNSFFGEYIKNKLAFLAERVLLQIDLCPEHIVGETFRSDLVSLHEQIIGAMGKAHKGKSVDAVKAQKFLALKDNQKTTVKETTQWFFDQFSGAVTQLEQTIKESSDSTETDKASIQALKLIMETISPQVATTPMELVTLFRDAIHFMKDSSNWSAPTLTQSKTALNSIKVSFWLNKISECTPQTTSVDYWQQCVSLTSLLSY